MGKSLNKTLLQWQERNEKNCGNGQPQRHCHCSWKSQNQCSRSYSANGHRHYDWRRTRGNSHRPQTYRMPSMPPPIEYSQGWILFRISFSRMTYWANAIAFYTKYLHFLSVRLRSGHPEPCRGMKFYIHHSIRNLNRGYSRCMDTGFGRGQPWSPTDAPTTDYNFSIN